MFIHIMLPLIVVRQVGGNQKRHLTHLTLIRLLPHTRLVSLQTFTIPISHHISCFQTSKLVAGARTFSVVHPAVGAGVGVEVGFEGVGVNGVGTLVLRVVAAAAAGGRRRGCNSSSRSSRSRG
jgi:hypothetical protein